MGRFKKGDKVKILKGETKEYMGLVGEIVDIDCFSTWRKYKIQIPAGYADQIVWRSETEIAHASPPSSAIRTVTKREIVPGTYGDVVIEAIPFAGREITYKRYANALSLREAARLFSELADVLEEPNA